MRRACADPLRDVQVSWWRDAGLILEDVTDIETTLASPRRAAGANGPVLGGSHGPIRGPAGQETARNKCPGYAEGPNWPGTGASGAGLGRFVGRATCTADGHQGRSGTAISTGRHGCLCDPLAQHPARAGWNSVVISGFWRPDIPARPREANVSGLAPAAAGERTFVHPS